MKRRSTIIAVVIMLAVGFAVVSTTLMLNGVVGLGESDDFKIIFTSAAIDGVKIDDVISESKTEISYETKVLSLIDEESTLEYEATNTSKNYDADVQIVCNIVDEDENIIEGDNEYVDMTYTPDGMSLLAGETKKGSITAKLKKAVTEKVDINIKCTLIGTAKERDTYYVTPFSKAGTMVYRPSYGETYFWSKSADITKVVFAKKIAPHDTTEDLIYDITGADSISPVYAYLVLNDDDNTKYTLYIQSETGVRANPSCYKYFYGFSNLESIEGLEYFDTSLATTMGNMFARCSKLKKLDLRNFNTSNVVSMNNMFTECSELIELNISNFDTSKVTDMADMFSSCSKLEKLDLSSFDTSSVKNMNYMFQSCSSLTELDLSNFITTSATMMGLYVCLL